MVGMLSKDLGYPLNTQSYMGLAFTIPLRISEVQRGLHLTLGLGLELDNNTMIIMTMTWSHNAADAASLPAAPSAAVHGSAPHRQDLYRELPELIIN